MKKINNLLNNSGIVLITIIICSIFIIACRNSYTFNMGFNIFTVVSLIILTSFQNLKFSLASLVATIIIYIGISSFSFISVVDKISIVTDFYLIIFNLYYIYENYKRNRKIVLGLVFVLTFALGLITTILKYI
ncbi:hypothetical protein ACV3X1_00475 [Clostridium perfringens]|uniref:hypothetical protein n=1 Tax=Clostridium perfringens TaxID=1502 RepID=UPI0013E305BB|nr:hypothetical protein [Clostridium perfringens]MDM0720332.1 hypothetical protein [Clostridium perfringens]MDM0723398.1 hypothetical protein [Clostridium perfringens]QPS27036.1 hypothetical protein I6G61_11430 [Clostridium perfringens]UBK42094.1 hypothetical protein KLF28_06255 [Clostridium perfringens]HAT4314991.1 hypothetical protein [Clostridium perfringens]